jgi:hypothetical protein
MLTRLAKSSNVTATAIPADDLRILGGAGRGQLSEWFDIFLLVFCRASREVL